MTPRQILEIAGLTALLAVVILGLWSVYRAGKRPPE